MLELKNISKEFNHKIILNNISFKIHNSEKIALVAANGTGKSTLIKIILGIEKSDTGKIIKNDNIKIAYIPQEIEINSEKDIETYIKDTVGINQLEKELKELEKDLNNSKNIDKYEKLQNKYIKLDAYNFDFRMKKILQALGLKKISNKQKIKSLSGGEKSKVAITSLLLQNPDLIILDEPTNNLDLASIIWLENYLQKTSSAVLIVSHDQEFLNNTVNKIIEIDYFTKNITIRQEKYSDFLKTKLKILNKAKLEYESDQKEINRLESNIKERRNWALKGKKAIAKDNDKYLIGAQRNKSAKLTKQNKNSEKRIKKLQETEKPLENPKLEIPLVASRHKAKQEINLKNISKKYNEFNLGPINLNIKYSERIALIGENGSGKSTILKIITKQIKPDKGNIEIGPSLKIGNFMQNHENMPLEKDIIEYFTSKNYTNTEKIYLLLNKFHFNPEDAKKKIKYFSPGERSKILLILFSLLEINVLILDEPSNHLDIEILEALTDSLKKYTGTIITVSHDRNFIEKINCDTIYELNDGKIKSINNFNEYIKKIEEKAQERIKELNIY